MATRHDDGDTDKRDTLDLGMDAAVDAGDIDPPLATLSVTAVRDSLNGVSEDIGRLERARLAHIAELFRRRIWEDDHTWAKDQRYDDASAVRRGAAHDMSAWVSQNLQTSRFRAKRLVDAALALERLPRTSEALRSGRVSLDKVVELTRYVTPETERAEITWARRVSVRAVKARADEMSNPDRQETNDNRNGRYLQFNVVDDSLYLNGRIPVDVGAAFTAAVDAAAKQLTPAPGDQRLVLEQNPIEQRRADALIDLVMAGAAGGSEGRDPITTEVVVHTSLHAHGFGNAVNGHVVLGSETVERITCDPRLRFVLTDDDGNPLGIGHASPVIPPWLRRSALKAYDHTCTFPGCDARRVDVHHLVHWTKGGPTDLDNLAPMCRRHHALVHEHDWNAFRGSKGTITWHTPAGRPYLPGPAPPDP